MPGIDAVTGRPLAGWPHVVQSIGIIISTRLGERCMRRWFGSVTMSMLGSLANRRNLLRLMQSIAVAIDLHEPRFHVLNVTPVELDRAGRFKIIIEGEYRPRGHLGDLRPEGTRRITLLPSEQGIVAT